MADRMQAPLRTSLAALAALAAIAAGGCSASAGTPAPAGSTPQSPSAPAPSASTGVSAAPSASAPTGIPASAFLEVPANMRRDKRSSAEGSNAVPKLCDGELAAGTGAVASAAMMTIYKRPEDPADSVAHAVLYQTIRSYSGANAAAFMDRLDKDLAGCRSYKDGKATVKVKTAPLRSDADEALTIDLVRPQTDLSGDPAKGEQTNRIVVMRFDSVVTILYDAEYERSSSVPAIVDTFVREATKAIESWRG